MATTCDCKKARRCVRWLLICLFAALVGSIAILNTVPPVSRDALVHHLALPKIFLKHGEIVAIPWLEFSYYPMNLDLLYTLALGIGSDVLPKTIHFVFALLTVAMIARHLQRRLSLEWGMVGGILFLSVPVIVRLSTTAYVDLGLIFFSTAALLGVVYWLEYGFQWRWLVAGAFACGLALGTKYNGLIVLFVLTLLVPFAYARFGGDVSEHAISLGTGPGGRAKVFSGAIFRSIAFFTVAIAIFSPWMIRNGLLTGNPLFPLFDGFFHPLAVKAPSGAGHFAVRRLLYDETWWQIVLVPVRIFFQGEDGNPQMFDGILNPYLILLLPVAVLSLKGNSRTLRAEKTMLLCFSTLYLLLAYLGYPMRARYIAPIIPPLAILAVYASHWVWSKMDDRSLPAGGKICRWSFCLIMVALAVPNGTYIAGLFKSMTPVAYLSGKISRDDYIERHHPAYGVIRQMNRHLSEDAKILGLFLGRRGYYIDREIRFDLNVMKTVMEDADSVETIGRRLEEYGFTHMFIRQDLFIRWVEDNFDDVRRDYLKEYLKNRARVLFMKNGYALFQLEEYTESEENDLYPEP